MNAQTLEKSTTTNNPFAHLPQTVVLCLTTTQVSSLGFDLDEEELAQELSAELPEPISNQTNTEINMDELEDPYLWFYS